MGGGGQMVNYKQQKREQENEKDKMIEELTNKLQQAEKNREILEKARDNDLRRFSIQNKKQNAKIMELES